VRYWSWLFAAPPARAPLAGIYALSAEWQALMDPATESSVARVKLAWWHDEMQRLAAHSGVHPISNYLAALPRAASVDFSPLLTAVRAAAIQISGAPLESGADLEPQSQDLWGGPLRLASLLCGEALDEAPLRTCTGALAAAHYLSRAIRDYRREARIGRVPFAVDELLAAGIDNADLAAERPPQRLTIYLERLRERAAGYFHSASRALPPDQQPPQRHLLIIAALGHRHMSGVTRSSPRWWRDLFLSWTTARRAQR